MSQFYSEENLRMLVNIAKKYLEDKYSFVVDDEKGLRKLTYQVMTDVEDECHGKTIPLERKNVAVLNSVKEVYIQRFKLSPSMKKPNVQSLNRDTDVYGNRPVNATTVTVPEIDPYQKKAAPSKDLSRLMEERDVAAFGPPVPKPDITRLPAQTKDNAENNDEFMKKLKELEDMRKELDISKRNEVDHEIHETLDPSKHDPKTIFMNSGPILQNPQEENKGAHKELTINPKTAQRRTLEKYIGVNSQDRTWWVDDINNCRYKYNIQMYSRFRNIDSITVGKVIIPEEVSTFTTPGVNFNFALAYPYVILKIEEFNDVYDGVNSVIKSAFCKLVYKQSYRGPNGRGYIILKPEQKERKYFYPAPLGVLNKLSISLLKPNGQLINTSKDDNNILTITHDIVKPKFYKVTTTKYFDKNEYAIGDTVILKDYVMSKLSGSQGDLEISTINDFMNRPEGHDIMELGGANGSGFYNSFYIEAIGSFNSTIGQFSQDVSYVTCINAYNNVLGTPSANGKIMNLSLQNSISMKLDVIVDDAKILDTQSVFAF